MRIEKIAEAPYNPDMQAQFEPSRRKSAFARALEDARRVSSPAKAHPALIAVWAAVTAAAQAIPTVPMLGTGSSFSFAAALTPLAGIFFGPIYGALCAAAGGFVGSLLAPHTAWMGPATFVIGTVTAFTTGCIAWGGWPPAKINRKGSFVINGGIIVYVLGTALWFSHETGRSLARFPLVFYGAGLVALLLGSAFAPGMLTGKSRALKFPALMLCAFGGMAGGASVGNFFSLVLFDLPRELWAMLTFVAPLERLAFSVGTAAIGLPLLASLPKAGIHVGPQPAREAEPEGQGSAYAAACSPDAMPTAQPQPSPVPAPIECPKPSPVQEAEPEPEP